jgi:outer membrane protein OmpA-like peptidoglycan-associated protein
MGAKTNRLLMLLVGAAIAGCAGQTDRSSSGGGASQAQVESEKTAAPPPPPPPPPYEPEKEPVQFVDRPLEDAPPPKPAAVAVAPKNEPVPEFPITKYELPEDEEVEDLGPLEDESASEEQDAAAEEESSVVETTEYAEEEADEEIEELGSQEDESVSEEQEAAAEEESSVGETTEYAEEEDEEIEELGPQEDESASAEQEAVPAGESSVGETTAFAEEEESEEVEDLGTQPDDSGTVSYPEEKHASADNLVSEPKVYADEPAQKAVPVPPKPQPATPRSVSVNFETEPLFSFDRYAIRADQKTKLDELIASLGGAEIESITVIGHTDRIGTTAYNQRLSERRAESVKNYLVNKGIPADRIHTEGRGKSEPVSGDACNKTRGKKLISCLQPDRRVDVSVSGSKRSN